MNIIELNKSDISFKSVLYFSEKYLVHKNNYIASGGRQRRFRDNIITIHYSPPYGENELLYKDKKITLLYNKVGESLATDHGEITYYKELILKTVEPIDFLKTFIKDAMDYYYNNFLDKNKEQNKFSCWVWDEYWEDLYKKKKRSIKSISLGGKELMVLEDMKTFLSNETEELYETWGIPYKKNYLFDGLPGTGKTSLIYALASELNLDVAIINFNKDLTDLVFMKAVQRIPEDTILVLEDMDCLFEERMKNDEYKHSITFSGLLNILDGLGHQGKLITIMTTNYKNKLDKALLRPGRIDYSLNFTYATKEQLKHMFNRFYPNKEEIFDKIYSYCKSKRCKLTTAMFQSFLFVNINKENILDHLDELDNIVINNNLEDKKETLYT